MGSLAKQDEEIESQKQRCRAFDEVPGMDTQKAGGFASERYAQPCRAEVTQDARDQDDADELRHRCSGHSRADDEKLQRHRDRHERWNEHGNQSIAAKPFAKFRALAFGRGVIHESPSATMRGGEQNHVADRGTRHREACAEPRHRWTLDRDQDEESIEYAGHRYAR